MSLPRLAIPVLAAVAVVATMAVQTSLPPPEAAADIELRLGEVKGCVSEESEATAVELGALPRDTRVLRRVYFGPGGARHVVTVVIGGRTKNSIHRPELCLPAQGFLMRDPHGAEFAGVPWRLLRVERGAAAEPMRFAYTFFNQRGVRTASHVRRIMTDVWDRSFCGRIDRWVMMTVSSTGCDEDRFGEFLAALKEAVE
jgi:hypothetical protein